MIILDLRGLPPSPQRLLALVDYVLQREPAAVGLDWSDWYPWSSDRRVAPTYLPEALVTSVSNKIQATGVEQWLLLQSPLPHGYESMRGYRELTRAIRGGGIEREGGVRKLISDLYDDVCALAPDLAGILRMNRTGAAATGETERAWSQWGTLLTGDGRKLLAVADPSYRANEYTLEAAGDLHDTRGELLGSVEQRAGAMGWDAAADAVAVHHEVATMRDRVWAAIAELHERTAVAEMSQTAADERVVASLRRARCAWRAFRAAGRRLRRYYASSADPAAVDRYITVLSAGPRRELAGLHARVSLIRSL